MKFQSAILLLCCCGGASAFSQQNVVVTNSRNRISTTTTTTTTTSLANAVDISENAPRDILTMDEWTTNCGVQRSDGFQITMSSDNDYSVFTSEPIAAESPVCFVPNEMILSSEQTRNELEGSGIEDAEQLLTTLGVPTNYFPQYYLFLKVLMEYEQGVNSPWYPWLNSLPRKFSNGAAMTPYCYECLPPLVSKLSMNERVKFINFYKSLSKISFLSEETTNNQELAKWAYNIVYTRCFGTTLVPMADMFNHATESNVEIRNDENGNCVVYTTTDIVNPNTPLTLRYGDPTNPSHLFATYGFLDESSPATFCKIMNIPPTQALKDIGLDFTRMLFFKDTGDITEEVWDVLLYTVLEEQENGSSLQQEFYNAHMSNDADTKNAIHQQYFPFTLKKLRNHVDTFLIELDELSYKASTKDVNEHPRIPIILKHNEFVKQTFLKVQEKLNTM